jgi:hypothetical protein
VGHAIEGWEAANGWYVVNHRRHRPQISVLVPYRLDPTSPQRARSWHWLRRYWEWELPDAEMIVARGSRHGVFSKAMAVNAAAERATGRVFVILDSDAYMIGSTLRRCADAIDDALRREHQLWLVPYRQLYRLTEAASQQVLDSDPRWPHRFSTPPPADAVSSSEGSMHGKRFGAMATVMPREAFETVGGMDPRMRGWGGEDVAFVRALDTLYAKHKTVFGDVLHLWHARIGDVAATRMWSGQAVPRVNEQLAGRYSSATGDVARMRALVDEGLPPSGRRQRKGRA